jgi:hypothetical protein
MTNYPLSIYSFEEANFQVGFPIAPQIIPIMNTDKIMNTNYLCSIEKEEGMFIDYSVNILTRKDIVAESEDTSEDIDIEQVKKSILLAASQMPQRPFELIDLRFFTNSNQYKLLQQRSKIDDLYTITWILKKGNTKYILSITSDSQLNEDEELSFVNTFKII